MGQATATAFGQLFTYNAARPVRYVSFREIRTIRRRHGSAALIQFYGKPMQTVATLASLKNTRKKELD